jgi:hypothetical protein
MAFMRGWPEHRDRFLECFWPSQISSKQWLLEKMARMDNVDNPINNVYIFGGWYGIMAQLVEEHFDAERIYSVDIDPICEHIGPIAGATENRSRFVTCDMATFEYPDHPDVVINTSCEHITQATYDAWWSNVPEGTKFFLQSNDFFICNEHIRCADSVEDFVNQCQLNDAQEVKSGTLACPGDFTRFMVWGIK